MQELNDKKRLATSGANFARAYTVEFGSCQFPYNFTGCQDLAKQKVSSLHYFHKFHSLHPIKNQTSFRMYHIYTRLVFYGTNKSTA